MSDKTIVLTDNMWARVGDETLHWKLHVAPKQLVGGLLADLVKRCPTAKPKVEGTDEIIIDLPGMMFVHRKYQEIKLDLLTIKIPYHDFATICHWWKSQEYTERTFVDGRKYYKLHGWCVCLVLTPDQYELFMNTMEHLVGIAEQKANEEFEQRKVAMDKVNEVQALRDSASITREEAEKRIEQIWKEYAAA